MPIGSFDEIVDFPDLRPKILVNVHRSPYVGVVGIKTWGTGAAKSVLLQTIGISGFKVGDEEKTEVQRKYDVVRVMNPDDPEQYVETEVMTEYQARNKLTDEQSGKVFTLKYSSPQAGANTKIISRGNIRKSK